MIEVRRWGANERRTLFNDIAGLDTVRSRNLMRWSAAEFIYLISGPF